MSERDTPEVLDRLVGFGRFLRANGMAVGTGRILTFSRAATALDPFDRRQLHAAARASLVSRPEDFAKQELAHEPEALNISGGLPTLRRDQLKRGLG